MSFEELTKKLSPTLKRITYRLNGHFSFFNDEDLFQEALIHLWEDFQKGKLQDKTDSYILQGCYFHLKNYLRKTREKFNLISIDALTDNEEDSFTNMFLSDRHTQANFIDYLDNRLLVEAIQNNGLTKREKEVFLLSLQDLTTREIGQRLDISHVRVVKLRNRIRSKCKNLV